MGGFQGNHWANSKISPPSTQAGGLLVHSTGFPLPSLPAWAESHLTSLLGKDTPPKLYSGASLQVQRQQRMDEVESMFQQLQQRQVKWVAKLRKTAVEIFTWQIQFWHYSGTWLTCSYP